MSKETERIYPLVTEGYFGSEVEVLCFIEELRLYLVRINGEFQTYDTFGNDTMNLSYIDTDEIKNKVKKVKLKELDNFINSL